ncbi:hypothetical protein N7539_009232 [Penicillium diatomitis]|uniref:Uncharacterized protein n=1 Tax=Penicillium diatomitis TaxID=2819901 RepID=A0A9X0BJM0_9EURO|nr:uncharacterized protein N7539_009232 [Penicillium diatomitis]KAJ5469614.1 hypothetical protein N7539_009232 [Penicillium diatomitis]
MVSLGSLGRQSEQSRSTRPNTPGNDLAQPVGPGDSKLNKLKDFGRRRRTSVGNALSGFQEGVSKEFQALQTRKTQMDVGQEAKAGGQKKRAISRISDGSTVPSPSASPAGSAQRPTRPATNIRIGEPPALLVSSSILLPDRLPHSVDQSLEQKKPSRDPSPSARFYSSFQSTDTSGPAQPLSPSSIDSGQTRHRLYGHVPSPLTEPHIAQERDDGNESKPPVPPKILDDPQRSITDQSRADEANEMPAAPSTSSEFHWATARLVNETADPVELRITRDDSSEEVIMSPTAYPQQMWKPDGYY